MIYISAFFVGLSFLLLPVHSFAQECNPPFEMVTSLFSPSPGADTIWDHAYGDVDYDYRFASTFMASDGGVLTIGQRRRFDGKYSDLVFVTFDRLGREVAEHTHELQGVQNIVKVIETDGGYLILANIIRKKQDQIWLGFFDKAFKLKSQRRFVDRSNHFKATDIIPSIENGWVMSISSKPLREQADGQVSEKGLVYLLDEVGKKILERSYGAGLNDRVSGLSVVKIAGQGVGYIATGGFTNNSGKQVARMMRLSQTLSLEWQREHSRGLSANLNQSIGYIQETVLTFGDVQPINGEPSGVWLALIDVGDGRVLWQRFFHGEARTHNYQAQGVSVNVDNLITLLMTARSVSGQHASDRDGREVASTSDVDFAQVLTLTPRGITLGGDSYFFSEGVEMQRLTFGSSGEHILTGRVLVREEVQEKGKYRGHHQSEREPIREADQVSLPDVEVSLEAKKGLALLKQKISERPPLVDNDKLAKRDKSLVYKGWVVVTDAYGGYSDPCIQ